MRVSAPLQRRAPDAGSVDSESGQTGGGNETGDGGNDKARRSSCFARHRSWFATGAFLAVDTLNPHTLNPQPSHPQPPHQVAVLCVVWHVRDRAQKEAMEALASSPTPTPSSTSRNVHAQDHEQRHDPSAAITRNPLPARPPPAPAKAVSAEGGGTGAAGSGAAAFDQSGSHKAADAASRPERSEELLSEGKPVTSGLVLTIIYEED